MSKKGESLKHQGQALDAERAAYMIAWRDRHIEQLKERIAAHEQQAQLMEALLAFALFRAAEPSGAQEARVLEIPKTALCELLGAWECETQARDAYYRVCFSRKEASTDAAQGASE